MSWIQCHGRAEEAAARPCRRLPPETVTAWVRARLIKTARELRRPWEETPEAFAQRLQAVVADVNENCKVHDACAGFPGKLLKLIRRKGDRLHT